MESNLMSLSAFTNQNDLVKTKNALQYAAKLIKEIQFSYYNDKLPQQAEHSLKPHPSGLSTRQLKDLGKLFLNFSDLSISLIKGGDKRFSVSVSGHSAASLAKEVIGKFSEIGVTINTERIKKQISDESQFELNSQISGNYANTIDAVYTAFSRIISRFIGEYQISPILFWPHGFDMAFITFFTDDLTQGTGPHIMGGFSLGSAGIEEPYIYFYFFGKPNDSENGKYYPDNIEDVPLPNHSKWHTEGWKGLVIPYNGAIKEGTNFTRFIEKVALNAIKKIKPMMV